MKRIIWILSLIALRVSQTLAGEPATHHLPVREITVFKDGHAFIQHSGKMPVDEQGHIVLDYLPAPVLGTFWPYVDDEQASLQAVVAGASRIETDKTALTIREMIEANIGKRVIIRENNLSLEVTLVGIPARTAAELESYAAPNAGPQRSIKSDLVLVRTTEGIKALPIASITQLTFLEEPREKAAEESFRNRLTLDLQWKNQPGHDARVGMVYLQRGIRWIPNYCVSIDGNGKAVLKLEATLINELMDLRDVTANLVIGVPSFAFKDSVDPIALREDVARLSSNFQRNSRTAYAFSNAIMSQQVMSRADYDVAQSEGETMNLGPELGGSSRSEDLYMFTIDHITLRKGERMVLPIAEYELAYKDVYALDIPIAPPMEILRNLNQQQRRDLLQADFSPAVLHKIRIKNSTQHPFTTAPAMILKEGRIIAQGMMTYTSVGGAADVGLTTAVDINVTKSDNEIKRTPNAVEWNDNHFCRIDLAGKISLKNYKTEAVNVEITRHVLGALDEVGEAGSMKMVNPMEDKSYLPDDARMDWWYGYSWPWWWYRFNAVGRASWTDTLEPGEEIEHTYTWHYFWN